MFSDERFHALDSSGRVWSGRVEGLRVGVALATYSENFGNFCLNKGDMDRVRNGLRDDKIDKSFVVYADRSNGNAFRHQIEAEVLHRDVLQHSPPIKGRFGEFWPLPGFDEVVF
jgi:hypothetical protein